jgi:hypothetical protein
MIARNYIFGRKYGANFLEGLVAYYPLDSNANDFSGKGYNGTLVGPPLFFLNGVVNNCSDFVNDGSFRYINIADQDDFSFTNGTNDVPFTISTWVYFSSFSTNGNWLISKRTNSSGGDEYQFAYSTSLGLVTFTLYDKANNAVFLRCRSLAMPSLNTWINYAITYDGSGTLAGLNLYQNGVIQNNKQLAGTYTGCNNGSSIVRLGMTSWTVDAIFKHKGLMDETAFWKNRELNATEILELYNKGNAGLPLI